jgi:hypothetical protein
MAKIVAKQHNDLNFGRWKTLWKSTITFNDRIDDGHIEFPICYCLTNLMHNPPSLRLKSSDQNII